MGCESRPGTTAGGSRLDAALFDLDGTLVDTEGHWAAAQHALAARHGVTWTDADVRAGVGQALLVVAAALRERGVDRPEAEIVEAMVDHVVEALGREIRWQPGARRLLTALRAEGVPCALVTMSYRRVADRIVAALPAGTFGAVVAGDEVARGKPDPEAYQRAAHALAARPEHSVAIEDSPAGVASARAAGLPVVVVPGVREVPPGPCQHRVSSLEDLDPADLAGRVVGDARSG